MAKEGSSSFETARVRLSGLAIGLKCVVCWSGSEPRPSTATHPGRAASRWSGDRPSARSGFQGVGSRRWRHGGRAPLVSVHRSASAPPSLALSRAQHPDNEYLRLHSDPSWKTLKLIWSDVPEEHTKVTNVRGDANGSGGCYVGVQDEFGAFFRRGRRARCAVERERKRERERERERESWFLVRAMRSGGRSHAGIDCNTDACEAAA